jgi:acetyltransferase-like isoleucine patch superfamily enzyme
MIKRIIHQHPALRLKLRIIRMWLFYRIQGYRYIDKTSYFIGKSRISKDIVTGPYSSVGPHAWIGPKVELGKYVLIAPNVTITGDDHNYESAGIPVMFSGRPELRRTLIEDDVWIGQNVSIRAGVVVGRGSILGMGAVITKDVEPYSIVGGVPAKVIGRRFKSRDDEQKHDSMLKEPAKAGEFCLQKR